ncbi:MAG: DUF1045 domain-containing protein [Patescibacteria group bacterium]|nr:DUF1045 domain-containing protein [Patescibacteria group bacterium]MDE2014925.1 DUF1045 domain-containing protein [Patescibacteria group bacterium]MDE2226354.1 DUF1045 domain-containing protein [Patescibacteria group bacterium]
MKVLPYNIAILPPAAIRRKAIKISAMLRKKGGMFSLGEKKFVPHITIYILDLPAKNEKKAISKLKSLAAKMAPIEFNSLRYRNSGRGYAEILYKKNRAAVELQGRVVKAINPLREGIIRDRYKSVLNVIPRGMRENVNKFGFSDVGVKYRPHLTLTRFPNNRKADLKMIGRRGLSFVVSEIGIYRRGENGTCRKLIAKFILSLRKSRNS